MQPHVRRSTYAFRTIILVKNHADLGNKAVTLWSFHMGRNKEAQKNSQGPLADVAAQNGGVGNSC